MFTPRRILLTIDFSAHSDAALEIPCSIARDTDTEVMVLNVLPPPTSHREVAARRQDDSFWSDRRNRLHQVRPKDPATPVSHLLEESRPATVILETARTYGCDPIVLGTHGRTGVCRAAGNTMPSATSAGIGSRAWTAVRLAPLSRARSQAYRNPGRLASEKSVGQWMHRRRGMGISVGGGAHCCKAGARPHGPPAPLTILYVAAAESPEPAGGRATAPGGRERVTRPSDVWFRHRTGAAGPNPRRRTGGRRRLRHA